MTTKDKNHKYIIISLLNGEDKIKIKYFAKSVNNPTIYELDGSFDSKKETEGEFIKNILKEHIKKFGTIDEIMLIGHGGSTDIIGSKNIKINLLTYTFLDKIEELKNELSCSITNRIVFNGCEVFSNLRDGEIKYYSDFAKENKIEIVGTTSIICDGPILPNSGRYVKFSTDGKIVRDSKLDHPNHLFSLLGNDTSWTDFYIGHTAEEGAILKKTYEIQQKNERDAETKRQILQNKMADNGPKF